MIGAFLLGVALAAEPLPTAPDWSDRSARESAQLDVIAGLIDAGLAEQALQAAAEARAQGSHDGRLDVLQARAMHAAGMHAEAAAMLEGHLDKSPRDASGWSALGVVRADQGDTKGSLQALERAHRLSPSDPTILNNLGYVQMAAGQSDAAVASFQRSLALDPSQGRTRNNLGFALARLERDTQALEAFRAAGSEADAHYNLGTACLARGDRASALSEFNAALATTPGHPAATAALAQLLQEPTP
jgi:Flp pilus assembly protein TadD